MKNQKNRESCLIPLPTVICNCGRRVHLRMKFYRHRIITKTVTEMKKKEEDLGTLTPGNGRFT